MPTALDRARNDDPDGHSWTSGQATMASVQVITYLSVTNSPFPNLCGAGVAIELYVACVWRTSLFEAYMNVLDL